MSSEDRGGRGRGRGRGRGSDDRGRGSADRGRGGRGRGGDDMRGRGSAERGRGEGSRGRGSFERGRGSFERGRGDYGGGRGDGRGRGSDQYRGRGRGQDQGFGGYDGSGDSMRGGRGRGDRGGRGGRGDRGRPFVRRIPPAIFTPDPVARVDEFSSVTSYEDDTIKNRSQLSLSALSLDNGMPRRPGYSSLGVPCTMYTNFFNITATADQTKGVQLYRYDLTLEPENKTSLVSKIKRRNLIIQLLSEKELKGEPVATDYSSIIISIKKLELGAADRKEFKIVYRNVLADSPDEAVLQDPGFLKRNRYNIKMQYLNSFSLSALLDYLSDAGPNAAFGAKLETIQAMNIVINSGPNSTKNVSTSSTNSFFPYGGPLPHEEHPLGQGLIALRGYYSSVRAGPSRLLLNLNVSHGAFYRPGSVLELFEEFKQGSFYLDEKELNSFVRNLMITTSYNGRKIVKSIFAFARGIANSKQQKFLFENKQVTVQQYFQNQYQINLRRPDAPVINCGDQNKPVWIPAELCSVIPGQPARRLLSQDQTRSMILFAARPPNANLESIVTNGFKLMGISDTQQENIATKFGIQISPKVLEVPARRLNPPRVTYSRKQANVRDGGWNLIGQEFFKGSNIATWACRVICLEGKRSIEEEHLAGYLDTFRAQLRRYGVSWQAYAGAEEHEIPGLQRNPQTRKAIDDMLEEMFTRLKSNSVSFVLVVLPRKDRYLYARVKYFGDIKFGIHSIGILQDNLEKNSPDTFANVAHKFNLKAGGINHLIREDELKPLDKNTIVFGIDVTHPSPASSNTAPSVAGVVASVDDQFAQWPASIRVQERRKEMVTRLGEMVEERLRLWQLKNKRLPNKMIVFRDGVSEGDFRNVLDNELPAMNAAFLKVYGKKTTSHPKLAIIIVGKRHHARFYPTKDADADARTFNPKPGTVVDRHITGYGDKVWDFYLQAHKGLQGTAKPGHYIVLRDEIGFSAESVIRMTHNLCYNFGRSTKAVSICPPAYYADLLCERGRAYLHDILNDNISESDGGSGPGWEGGVHEKLQNSMFYI